MRDAGDAEDAEDLELLEHAARKAGEIALRHFRTECRSWDKGDGQGPVTAADIEIDAALRAELTAARPDYGWLSEESPPARDGRARCFVVDPIDGTRAFIAGEPGFAVSLAVVEGPAARAGLVHLPARDETYAAHLGGGARRNGAPIRASAADDLVAATALGARPQFRAELWPGGAPPCARHFRPSLAWRLCLVAAGRFDVMLTLRDSHDWDIAAGSLIATEAGATVTDGQGGPLDFSRARPCQPGVIAAPPALHRQLLALRQPPVPSGL